MTSSLQHLIVQSCEIDLRKFGDTFEGAGWTKKKAYAERRYQVMLDIIRPATSPITLLDFGCGISHMYEYMKKTGIRDISYSGLDLSDDYLALSQAKFPDVTYHKVDILDPAVTLPQFDYIILSGVLSYKGSATYQEMFAYCQNLLRRVAAFAKIGIAFNVMSKHVDWERDDLFHLPMTELATFIDEALGRRFTIRHDYDLFEYTTYVYFTPYQDLREGA